MVRIPPGCPGGQPLTPSLGHGEDVARPGSVADRTARVFEETRKRPLPLLPRKIGIITSPTGAVIRDMLTIIGRRFPGLEVLIHPVAVQGEGAAADIAAALGRLPLAPPVGSGQHDRNGWMVQ